MCGRFSLASDPAKLAVELDAVDEASTPLPGVRPAQGPRHPRFNIAPTTTICALLRDTPLADTQGADGEPERVLRAMRWGLVPSWAKDEQKLPNLFNARVETAAEKPSFRAAVQRRHAIIPMDGWYEWVTPDPGTSGRAGAKQPFYMTDPGQSGLFMAGLWERRRSPRDSEVVELSCTIVTTEAMGPLTAVHHRMPLVVSPELVEQWLDPQAITDPRELVDRQSLMQWAESIMITPVSRAVSNVRNDGPELIRPLDTDTDGDTGRLF